ncbi:MAG: hypothetical protein WCJ64_08440 [Rhodospirillaceae bacterium]
MPTFLLNAVPAVINFLTTIIGPLAGFVLGRKTKGDEDKLAATTATAATLQREAVAVAAAPTTAAELSTALRDPSKEF